MPVITYYMSVTSPWTYLGSARFAAIARKHGYSVDIKPARFGEVFAKTGGLPLPKRSPERRAYRLMDMKRWRDHLGMPVNVEPKYFPVDDAPGARLVIAAKLAGKDLTGQKMLDALESGDPYLDIFNSPPSKFSKTNHLANTITQVQQVKNGRWVVIKEGLGF